MIYQYLLNKRFTDKICTIITIIRCFVRVHDTSQRLEILESSTLCNTAEDFISDSNSYGWKTIFNLPCS